MLNQQLHNRFSPLTASTQCELPKAVAPSVHNASFPHRKRALHFVVLFPTLTLISCSSLAPVGPDYQEPKTELPTSYRFEASKNGKPAASRDKWWQVFRDPGLNDLISEVRRSNQELRAGLARVAQARQALNIAGADRLPDISTSPSATRSQSSDEVNFGGFTLNTFAVPIDASWELDLFGRIRRNIEAASADTQASEQTLADLRLSLESQAAIGYYSLRALDKELDVVQDELDSRKESLKVAQARFDLGAESNLDVSRSRSELAATAAELADLRRQRIAQETSLAILAGQAASNFTIPHSPLKGKSPRIPSALPSELLRARPDIQAAERKVAAANARIGIATAAFYPSVSLTGQVGVASNTLRKLFTSGGKLWSIGPEVYLPIFQGGRNRANLAISQAAYEETLADYQQVVLQSLAEVENRLAATHQIDLQDQAQSQAVKSAQAARRTARAQYDEGLIDYLTVLDAERTSLDVERDQAVLTGSEFINTVNLIRALGGRW